MKTTTKAEEKAYLWETFQNLSEGYARSILLDLMPEMERAIDSDFAFIPFGLRVQQEQEHYAAMIAARKELSDIKAAIADAQRLHRQLTEGITAVRSDIARLARM